MEARLVMRESEYWEREEFTALSSFLKGACCPTKVLVLIIYLDRIDRTRQEAMKTFGRIGKLVSEDYIGQYIGTCDVLYIPARTD